VEFLHRLDLLTAFPLMLLPVRITPRKNIELALHVLARLRKNHPGAMLVVTGPPGPHNPGNQSYLNRLLALRQDLGLAGAAHFLTELQEGFLPDETVRDFYRLADLLFLPSLEEGFGIPILEAGLAGVPVFCADIPPLRELGAPFVDLFSPDAEPGAVAVRIAARLGDAQVGLRARVRSRYTWEQIYRVDIAPLLEEG
jgi:glycosyltransferase involved in cell wall biosynthesis